MRDPVALTTADAIHREKIHELRSKPHQIIIEETSRGPLKIEFDLELKKINPLPFHATEDFNQSMVR